MLFKERALHRRIAQAGNPLYLNLGSGPRGRSDKQWLNVDGYRDRNVDYVMDLSREWPFTDNTFDGIFCEHVFEHFDFDQGQELLREALRVLKPGNAIRLIVPDGNKILRAYCETPVELLAHRETGTGCSMEAVNSYFRQRYEHQCIYDWKLLEHQLVRAGFAQVARVSFGKGQATRTILLDDEKYEWESLYVEASKPGSSQKL